MERMTPDGPAASPGADTLLLNSPAAGRFSRLFFFFPILERVNTVTVSHRRHN